MTEEIRKAPTAQPRVATHQGVGGHAEERRRRFQKHLLLFLGVNLGLSAVDYYVIAPPGIQWAQWVIIPWVFVFLVHVLGLKSRGFPWLELVTPPEQPEIKEVYTEPLEYEVIRARQLRDGISNAASSVGESQPDLARSALSVADALVDAIEGLYTAEASRSSSRPAAASEAQEAVKVLNQLHESLIRIEVLDAAPAVVDVDAVRERAEKIRSLSS